MLPTPPFVVPATLPRGTMRPTVPYRRLPHFRGTGSVVLALLLGACADPSVEEEPPFDLLITDVAVVDVVAGETLGAHSVAVRDGRITSLWPADEAPEAVQAERVLDGEGRYLVPGLWDAHVHHRGGSDLRDGNRALLPLYPLNGVTTVRDAGGDLTAELLAWRDSIAAGALLGPRILVSGPKLDGPDPSWEGSLPLADPADVSEALDSLQAVGGGAGVDYVKLYDGSMSPEVFLAAVRQAEERGLTITGHMPLGVDFLEAVEEGLDGTEHLYYVHKGTAANRVEVTEAVRAGELGFWDAFAALLDERDPEREETVFGAMAERGTVAVPTLHIGAILSEVERTDHTADPELDYIPAGIQETYAGRVASAERASLESRENNRALRAEFVAMVPRMHAAGVRLLAGSDAGAFNSFTYPGFALHDELEALVDAGLPPVEALRSATMHPADFMGMGGDHGRIAEGAVADLVLLRGDPLEDITATRRIEAVVLRGQTVLAGEDLGSAWTRAGERARATGTPGG